MVSRFRNARKSVQFNKGETASGQKEKRSKRTYRRKGSHDSLSLEFLRVTTNKTEFDQFSPSTECMHSFASCSCSYAYIYEPYIHIFISHARNSKFARFRSISQFQRGVLLLALGRRGGRPFS